MIPRRYALGSALLLSIFSLPLAASAEVGESITRARGLFERFEYDEAVELLETVVGDPAATAAQRVTALEITGAIHLLQSQQDRARQAFERLLDLDPGHEVDDPDLPPRVRQSFEAVRDDYLPTLDLEVDLEIPAQPAGETVQARATLSGGGGVAEAILFVREAGEESYASLPMTPDGEGYLSEVELPPAERALEYYLEMRAPSGHVLGGLASSLEPRSLTALAPTTDQGGEVTPRSERAWYRTWWFWTIVGVVLAGGTTAAVVAATRPEEHQDGTLGSVQMPLLQF